MNASENFPWLSKLPPDLQKIADEINKNPSAWKENHLSEVRGLRMHFRLPDELADARGDEFRYDPASLARINSCIDALQDAIARGNAIRRHPMEHDGNVVFMQPRRQ